MILLLGSAACVLLGFLLGKINEYNSGRYWLYSLSSKMVFGGLVAFVITVFIGFLPPIVDFIATQFDQLWSL